MLNVKNVTSTFRVELIHPAALPIWYIEIKEDCIIWLIAIFTLFVCAL